MNLEIVAKTTSTHSVVLEKMRQGAPHGSALVAMEQTAGRGRRGRTWASPQGSGLYLSIGLKHPGLSARMSWLPLLTGVELAELLDPDQSADVRVKWPNDLLHNGKKLAGILSEGSIDDRGDLIVVLSPGINLSPPPGGWPIELAHKATSAADIGLELEEAAQLARKIGHRLLALADTLTTELPDDWRERWLRRDATLGRRVMVDGDPSRGGVAVDLDHDGALLCERPDGSTARVVAGEVEWLPS